MEENEALLGPLLTDQSEIKREAIKRRKPFDFVSVKKEKLIQYQAKGWEKDKKLKTKTRLRRPKSIDDRLKNKLWLLFYRMGYHELSQGNDFSVLVKKKGDEDSQRRIDVYAKDDETVLVAECKASETLTKKRITKDIEKFGSLKGVISRTIKQFYGQNFKPKIIWFFVTENIIWAQADIERAAEEKIQIITERELRYYLQISDHLGPASRFQFLAEFLKNQKIPHLSNRILPAIRGTIGGNKFYSFVTTPESLLKISFVNHRSLNDPDGMPTYQRLINRSRMKQIKKFLEGGGYFPTNILVNFTRKITFDTIKKDEEAGITFGYLHLPDRYRSAWIIDGQHRLYGFAQTSKEYRAPNIFVLAFEKMETEEEANLFVTINHEQKSVPKNLLDDLEGELKWGSDKPVEKIGAIAARLINVLNNDIGDPFYGKITRQGIPATDTTCLTVPALKEGLKKSGLLGKSIRSYKTYSPGAFSGSTDSETLDRARIALNHFFSLIRENAFDEWERGRKGFLCTNVGVQGYTLLLASLVSYMTENKKIDPKELTPQEVIFEIKAYANPVLKWVSTAKEKDFESRFKVQFGSGGPREYYFRLCAIIKSEFPGFTPEGMDDWEAERSEEKVETADKRLKEINIWVQKYIFDKFKQLYGTDGDTYWEKGVTDNKIKTEAYSKSQDEEYESRLPLENYLEFIQYKKIIEHKQNWPHFRTVFNIVQPGDKGIAKNIKWMDRINELRRIPAHATEKRQYKLEDYDYIDFVYEKLTENL